MWIACFAHEAVDVSLTDIHVHVKITKNFGENK